MASKNGINGIKVGKSDLWKLDPRDVTIAPEWNQRDFDDPANIAHVQELKASIREVGVKEPLTVVMEGDVPVLTNGECRLRAVKELIDEGVEIKSVPVQTEPRSASAADRVASQLIRNSGKGFTPLEMAGVVAQLDGHGWTDQEIATKAGLVPERIAGLKYLNQATVVVRQLIRDGKISATMAEKEIRKVGAEKAEETLLAAVSEAEDQGKSKAGPRHVKAAKEAEDDGETVSNKPTKPKKAKTDYQALFMELLDALGDETETDGTVTAEMKIEKSRWAEILKARK